MKLALLATALLIGSNVVAVSGEKNLNFKLVTIYMGEKDGESHLTGVTVSPDGSLGTKDFYDKAGENGAETGHSVYYFPNGTLVANYKGATTGTATADTSRARTKFYRVLANIRAQQEQGQSTAPTATQAH
jgi:hypothetical protein